MKLSDLFRRRGRRIGICRGCYQPVFESDEYLPFGIGVVHEHCLAFRRGAAP